MNEKHKSFRGRRRGKYINENNRVSKNVTDAVGSKFMCSCPLFLHHGPAYWDSTLGTSLEKEIPLY